MVIVNLEIAFAGNLQIKQSMTRKQVEHMIEERQARADLRAAAAVEVETHAHLSLFRIAVDFRGARLSFYFGVHSNPIGKLNQPAERAVGKSVIAVTCRRLESNL